MNNNPLLQHVNAELPLFECIKPEHILPALDAVLDENRTRISALLEQDVRDWLHLMHPMEELDERLSRLWGPVNHLNAVCDSDELRPIHRQGLMKLTAYRTELAQNETLFAAIRNLHDSPAFQDLNDERKQVIRHALRDFRLQGAELPPEKKMRFKEIQVRLSELGAQFEQHVLDATRAFELHLEHERDLAGLPQSIRDAARERAKVKARGGWLFTLDAPSYIPFMQYAENRDLRRQAYTAYATRASIGAQDNSPLIVEILGFKQEAARLLGYNNYGEVSLATKMAGDSAEVIDFLHGLARRGKPHARKEVAELKAFAATDLGLETLEAWDVTFASERLRQRKFDFSQEDLKP
ncbi:MAG: M3 family metallopeptidase, partial [Mariprofundaceae bacterium]|nr:M3 family metallopeptidase [Mariprofundaceae bacterium]